MDLLALRHQRIAGQRIGVLPADQHPDAADAQPVRGKILVANPALQVRKERRAGCNDRLRRGQPEELPAGHLDLRNEEIMISRQFDRRGEGDGEQDLFTRNRPLAEGGLVGLGVDAVQDAVLSGETAVQDRS